MINTLVAKVFGTKNEREIKRLMPRVEEINRLEPAMRQLSDDRAARARPRNSVSRFRSVLTVLPLSPTLIPIELSKLRC